MIKYIVTGRTGSTNYIKFFQIVSTYDLKES